jgi:hypothetical protein
MRDRMPMAELTQLVGLHLLNTKMPGMPMMRFMICTTAELDETSLL